ncbi:MAG TPA: hypothetical protein DDZ68_04110 [Parvularcula sp.]|nr:hypothetical protein [Parvularcula sp.]HBS31844.1 hypothetical protein [Parvularcula sp.]HBS34073.1 hypothetical protein [Parvularcula sp.]
MSLRFVEVIDPLAKKHVSVTPSWQPSGSRIIYLDDPHHPLSVEHNEQRGSADLALELWESDRLVVSGSGLLWCNNEILIDPRFMAEYWRQNLTGTKWSKPERDVDLPIRTIGAPVISALGWAANEVYGHFILEMLPRLIWADDALRMEGTHAKVLLTKGFPSSQLDALKVAGFEENDFEFFDPEVERVFLARGYFPTYAIRGRRNPAIAASLERRFPNPRELKRAGIAYVSRSKIGFDPLRRNCTNEDALEKIAQEFGAEITHPQFLPWSKQLELFHSRSIIVGLSGSGLHTSLLTGGSLCIGVVGHVNLAQARIAGVRGQRIGYQTKIRLSREYEVPLDGFRFLMDALIRAARQPVV